MLPLSYRMLLDYDHISALTCWRRQVLEHLSHVLQACQSMQQGEVRCGKQGQVRKLGAPSRSAVCVKSSCSAVRQAASGSTSRPSGSSPRWLSSAVQAGQYHSPVHQTQLLTSQERAVSALSALRMRTRPAGTEQSWLCEAFLEKCPQQCARP